MSERISSLTLVIDDTGNAAFEDGNDRDEIARILREVAKKIEDGYEDISVRDYNGNTVGTLELCLEIDEDVGG